MTASQPDFNLNGTQMVRTIWQQRYVFVAVGAVALVVSLVVSFAIRPQFKSTAILIPAASTQAAKDVFVPSRSQGLTVFGDDEEVEHLLQVLSSETLRRHIVHKHNLFAHFGVDPNDKHAWHKVNGTYSSNISFSPSRYRSVRIEVLDENPEMAATLANSIVRAADSLTREAKRLVAQKALVVLEQQYQLALEEAYRFNDSLKHVMSKGVLDMPYQAKEATKVYAEALASGNRASAERVQEYMGRLANHGAHYTRYLNDVQYKSLQLKDMQQSLHILRTEAQGSIPSQFVIDWAYPSDKKAKPKRMILVAVSTLSAMFFTLFLLVFIDFIRKHINPKGVEA